MNISKKITALLAFALVIATPLVAYGAVANFKEAVGVIIGLIKSLVPLVVALTLLVFIWGIFQLVRTNDEDARKEAIAVVTYGIVSLFVMVSVWGLVNILTSTFFSGGLIVPQLK